MRPRNALRFYRIPETSRNDRVMKFQHSALNAAETTTPSPTGPPQAVLDILRREDDFLVAGHSSPDGDALGSGVALCCVLRKLGKRYRHFAAGGVPLSLDWVETAGPVLGSAEELGNFTPRWVVTLDCGAADRLDEAVLKLAAPERMLNIDHHVGNTRFAAVNWVDTNQPAVGVMVAEIAKAFGMTLGGALGEAVYLAIISDTGHFSYSNTKPETLELAAEILRAGLDVGEFNARFEKNWSPTRLKLWASALQNTALHCGGLVGVVRIDAAILDDTGATRYDCDGLVEIMRRVRGVRVAASLREDAEGSVRISLRSHGEDDVQLLAKRLGGGGHKNAAGASVAGPLRDVEALLVSHCSEMLGLGCQVKAHDLPPAIGSAPKGPAA